MKILTNKKHVLVNHSITVRDRRANHSTKCDLFSSKQEHRHKWITRFNVGEKSNVSSPSLCHDYPWPSVASAQTTCSWDNQVSMLQASLIQTCGPLTKTVWFEWHTTQLSHEIRCREDPMESRKREATVKLKQPLLGQGRAHVSLRPDDITLLQISFPPKMFISSVLLQIW